jgi:hypothetical protein
MTRAPAQARVGQLVAGIACCIAVCGCDLRAVELAPNAQNQIVIGDVPASAIEKLRGAGSVRSDAARLAFVDPSSTRVMPQNLAPIAFEWQAAAGGPGPAPKDPKPPKDDPKAPMPGDDKAPGPIEADAAVPPDAPATMPDSMVPDAATPDAARDVISELRVRSPHSETRMYTRAHEAVLPEDRWRKLLRESAGSTLVVELRALFGPNEIWSAPPLRLDVQGPVPAGALYFWSTTAQGVMRARIDDARATYAAPQPAATGAESASCGGCHAVARDGRRLLVARGNPAQLDAYALPDRKPMWPSGVALPAYGWGTFDPTASRIAISSGGRLRVFDADSGQPLAQAELGPDVRVSHPDWSPDGRFIALTLWPTGMPAPDQDNNGDKSVTGSSIARVRVALDGSLAAPEVLVAAMAKDETLLFPSYSPDGAWIAFERAKGASKEAKEASLWLVAADGGKPIALARATATAKGAPRAVDSMPTWMPAGEPDRYWLLFSSTRARGSHVLAAGQEQLFLSAVDGAAAMRGEDPSQAPFWLPSQDLDSSNHRALFAADVVACVPAPEVCDGRDQDCDDAVDEDCCEPAPERCDNARDDDCDGRADEGCACQFVEHCGDGVDDDCDGDIDEDCAPTMPPPR